MKWEKVSFLDYILLNPKVPFKKGELYPFVDMANVDTVLRTPNFIQNKVYTSGVRFQKNDTVIARIEPCLQNGKRFLFKDLQEGFGSTEFLVFRAISNKTSPLFVYYFMQTHGIKNLMINSMSGATGRQRVNNDIFKHLLIQIPPLPIQTRIAEILSRYDDLIENYQRQISLLEEAAQRLYKEWFVDLHFPGYENTPIVDGVPEGWHNAPLANILHLRSGFAFKSTSFVSEGQYKLVTIKNVQDDKFDGSNVNLISEIPESMPNHCYLKTGDILLSLTGNVGRSCIVVGNDYLLNQRVAKAETEHPTFVHCLFHNRDMYLTLCNLANGAAQLNLSPIKAEKVIVLLPSEVLIKDFEKRVSPLLDSKIKLSEQINLLTEARDRLLPKLMNGEIEV